MWKMMVLAGALAAALAGPASAAGRCHEPSAPATIDGGIASKAQLDDAMRRVKRFLKRSDRYQACLLRRLSRAQGRARRSHAAFDPAIADATDAKIRNNQVRKEKAGGDFNMAVVTFLKRCNGSDAPKDCPVRPAAGGEP